METTTIPHPVCIFQRLPGMRLEDIWEIWLVQEERSKDAGTMEFLSAASWVVSLPLYSWPCNLPVLVPILCHEPVSRVSRDLRKYLVWKADPKTKKKKKKTTTSWGNWFSREKETYKTNKRSRIFSERRDCIHETRIDYYKNAKELFCSVFELLEDKVVEILQKK